MSIIARAATLMVCSSPYGAMFQGLVPAKNQLTEENKGQLDKALADFDRAIELNPKFTEAIYNRGLIRQRKMIREELFPIMIARSC
jgi:hypothetical protein